MHARALVCYASASASVHANASTYGQTALGSASTTCAWGSTSVPTSDDDSTTLTSVSYTHLRAHETSAHL
eukprot:12650272-Alexandrium_andersonii.AAC.1